MLSRLTLTILTNNRVQKRDLLAEDGLSFHIDCDAGQFLFDTGLSDVFLKNAEKLNIDMAAVQKIIFSHGHRDHTGGLVHYLKAFGKGEVICHYNIFNRKYRVFEHGRMEVGMPQEKSDLVRMGGDFILKTHYYKVAGDVYLSGEIPRVNTFELPAEFHQEQALESYITDPLKDDMALILNTTKGLVVLLGDTHSGLINTLTHVVDKTGKNQFFAIVGGLNLRQSPDDKVEKIAYELQQFQFDYLIPIHSTGQRAFGIFERHFPGRVTHLCVGDQLVLDAVPEAKA
ncbi:MAG TPA: MBL fold metallo-hydrolase [Calditrichia bacterium]|nr:MBL fold metallo-hydrolase [Calditrichota bacterium]HQU72612.1 MBL fold metallo-hydrolase [Calditrichia bacterium]HQV31429.1 MBL fold metallo-hydrolase [Calditrichia bacterium]